MSICGSDCDGSGPAVNRHHVDRAEPPLMVSGLDGRRAADDGRPVPMSVHARSSDPAAGRREPCDDSHQGAGAREPRGRQIARRDAAAQDRKLSAVDAGEVKAWEGVRKRAEEAVRALPGVQSALVALTAERRAAPPRPPQEAARAAPRAAPRGETVQGVPGVEAIIAVASGKGGVGKSTLAVNLALGLAALGLKVGVLDADIYGPSLPKLLAIKERPQTIGGTRLKPITRYGLTVM